jgi:hypothetical protein
MGSIRVPLLKLAVTLGHAATQQVGEEFELDFGGTVAGVVTFEKLATDKVRLAHEHAGVRRVISKADFDRAVQTFLSAVTEVLKTGCPDLLAAAASKGWLRVG